MTRYTFNVDCAFNESLDPDDSGPVVKVEDVRAVFERLRRVETREALLAILDTEEP
jgi:hypothetical protein